jgi:microsomal dipeptidase-like Zn-dependent dipeptidase
LKVLLVAGAIVLVGFFVLMPGVTERLAQGIAPGEPLPISSQARSRHAELTVVDWHADSLLWKRDLLERSTRGHVDVPRLLEGHVALQVFTAVTKSPLGLNYQANSGKWDMNTIQAVTQLWPPATWNSLLERALYQARKLDDFSAASSGQLRVIRSVGDLSELLKRRSAGETVVGGMLGIEGAHALEGELDNIDRLFAAGYRVVGLQHFFDNRLGGSLHGVTKGPLTDFGRAVVRRLEERNILVDLAHSSPAVVDDVLAIATRPVVVSHTGLHGICPTARNLSDDQMKRVAKHGGLIAIGYWDGAVCDISPEGVVAAIRYGIDLVGAEHIALGSDYDGGTTTAFDTSQLALLTQAMMADNFTDNEIERVMGGNAIRLMMEVLPH